MVSSLETRSRRRAPWLGLLLAVLALLLTVWSALQVANSMAALVPVAFGYVRPDIFAVLAAVELPLGLVGMAAAWFSLGRRAFGRATLFLLIQIPVPVFIAANRCDLESLCQYTDWMRLPQSIIEWNVPKDGQSGVIVLQGQALAQRLTGQLDTYPPGARVPQDFLRQAAKSNLGGHNACFISDPTDQHVRCQAFVLHFLDTDAPDVLLVAPDDRDTHHFAGEMFSRQPDGAWAKSGELVITCPDAMKALEKGAMTFTTARARDIVLAGRQFSLLLDPTYDCTKPGGVVGSK